jgi:inosine-uridine nucleoside N-ribohydrolase
MIRKIIIDTDPGVDDALAILMALASPELEVLGLTTIFGNAATEITTRNALTLAETADRRDIPVVAGESQPPTPSRPMPGPSESRPRASAEARPGPTSATPTNPPHRRGATAQRSTSAPVSTAIESPGSSKPG